MEGGERRAFCICEVVVPEMVADLVEPDAIEFSILVDPDGS